MDEQGTDLREYINALRRRRLALTLTAVCVLVIAVTVAFVLPPVYRSTATILIESQDVPANYVQSTVTSYASERIKTISQRVMTRSNLLELINKYGLYADERDSKTTEELVAQMQDNIQVEPITAEVMDPRSGRPGVATIAFTLSFNGYEPQTTRKVANELTTLFLNENVESRTQKARQTYAFLTDEAERLEQRIEDLESQMATFKEENVGRLPSLMQLNMTQMDRTENQIRDIEQEIRSLEDRRFYIEGQLAQTDPSGPIFSDSGRRIMDPESRVKAVRSEYLAKAAKYTARHPDVQSLKRELEALEKETGNTGGATELVKKLDEMRAKLSEARDKYSSEHPDVVQLENSVAELEAKVQAESERLKKEAEKEKQKQTQLAAEDPDNPAYISLQTQLESVNAQIASLKQQKKDLQAKLDHYEQRLTAMPQVESRYNSLRRQLENTVQKYRDIKAKQMEAKVSKQLETEAKGERFTLIEPPPLPEEPVSPNRPAIMFLGLVLSLGSGIGYVAVAESLDSSVRGVKGVTRTLGMAPLSVIPYIENGADRARRRRWLIAAVVAAFVIVASVVAAVHFLWMPLDIFWIKVMQKLGWM